MRKAVGQLRWFLENLENYPVAVAMVNGQEEANSIGSVKKGDGALG